MELKKEKDDPAMKKVRKWYLQIVLSVIAFISMILIFWWLGWWEATNWDQIFHATILALFITMIAMGVLYVILSIVEYYAEEKRRASDVI